MSQYTVHLINTYFIVAAVRTALPGAAAPCNDDTGPVVASAAAAAAAAAAVAVVVNASDAALLPLLSEIAVVEPVKGKLLKARRLLTAQYAHVHTYSDAISESTACITHNISLQESTTSAATM
jgi:hypothetical protein